MLHLDQVQIKDFDLYGEKEPWEIWDLHGGCNLQSDEDLYFFTKLKKKSQNGSRINRSVGTGTWMGEDSGKPIYSQLSAIQPLGFKRRFRYEGGVPQQVGQWIMHEYSLNTTLVPENDQGYLSLSQSLKALPWKRNEGSSRAEMLVFVILLRPWSSALPAA
ncbi:NAC domain - like 10 [Theobroma cacao]|nr:NAC domain - like 10 [Theobroma cacao]